MSGSEATETVSISWDASKTLTRFDLGRLCGLLPLMGTQYRHRLGEALDGGRCIGADVTLETTTIRVSDQPGSPDDLRLPDDDKAGAAAACFVALALARMLEPHGAQGLESIRHGLQDELSRVMQREADPLEDAGEDET